MSTVQVQDEPQKYINREQLKTESYTR